MENVIRANRENQINRTKIVSEEEDRRKGSRIVKSMD